VLTSTPFAFATALAIMLSSEFVLRLR